MMHRMSSLTAPLALSECGGQTLVFKNFLEVGKINIWWFPEIGVPPNHPVSMGFSIINHPFGGTHIYGNPHIFGETGKLFVGICSIRDDVVPLLA